MEKFIKSEKKPKQNQKMLLTHKHGYSIVSIWNI